MERRNFLSLAAAAVGHAAYGQSNDAAPTEIPLVHGTDDRIGHTHAMGASTLAYKVVTSDSHGALFVAEQNLHGRGGPPLHMHLYQDEWFYVLEGQLVVEVGGVRHLLNAGDSVLGPRQVPHRWFFAGEGQGKFLISFAPAGKIESFFDAVAKTGALPAEDKALFAAHDMVMLGPALTA